MTTRSIPTHPVPCVVCGGTDAAVIGSARDFEYHTSDDEFRYGRCPRCGHVQLIDLPEPGALPRLYPEGYGNHDAGRGRSLTFRVKALLDARKLTALGRLAPPVRHVLDVGAADGQTLELCRQVFPGAGLEGIEISEQAARGARARGHQIRIGSIESIELPADRYELVIVQQVIEHVHHPDRVLDRLARALSPGGLLLLETPNVEAVDFRLFHARYWGGYHAPRHFHLFSTGTLGRLVRQSGLEVARTSFSPQPIHWVWTLHHYLEDRGAPRALTAPLAITNPVAIGAGTLLELVALAATGQASNLVMVARRRG